MCVGNGSAEGEPTVCVCVGSAEGELTVCICVLGRGVLKRNRLYVCVGVFVNAVSVKLLVQHSEFNSVSSALQELSITIPFLSIRPVMFLQFGASSTSTWSKYIPDFITRFI